MVTFGSPGAGYRAEAGAWVIAVLAAQVHVLRRHQPHRLWVWALWPSRRHLQRQSRRLATQNLSDYRLSEHLAYRWWDGVSQLPANGDWLAADSPIWWEALQPQELGRLQSPTTPVEGAGRRAGLGLECPRWSRLCEFQEEAPIAAAPSEEWLTVAAGSVVQVVGSFGDRWEKARPFSRRAKRWIEVRIIEIPQRIPRTRVRQCARNPICNFLGTVCAWWWA